MIPAYNFALWFHILAMGYWFGAEVILQSWGWYFARADHMTYVQRKEVWDQIIDADQHVRNALILIMPFGFTLAAQIGVSPITGRWLVLVWGLSAAWFAIMWIAHLTLKTPYGKAWRDLDFGLRLVIAPALIGVGVVSLITHRPFAAGWLSAKLILFGLIILCGVSIRIAVRKVYAGFALYERSGGVSTPEIERQLYDGNKYASWAIRLLWVLAFSAGYLGAAKPF